MLVIGLEERIKYRETIANLQKLEDQLDASIFRQKPLDPRTAKFLFTLTNTEEVEQQYEAVVNIKNHMRQQFDQRLLAAAPKSLSHFVEYMTPDEPPARHHDWMCKHMEAVEARNHAIYDQYATRTCQKQILF